MVFLNSNYANTFFIPKRFVMRYYAGYLYCLWLKCRPISPKALSFSFCYSTLSLLIVNSS